ncbi:MAG TPA: type II toxin-antitoxin system PemK/MazF family toxin [Acidimicrobiales bacterium]
MDRGQIVLAPFLYSDLVGMKRRPACVVSSTAYNSGPDVILAMVTSRMTRLQAPTPGDAVLTDWQAAGLSTPSVIRAGRLLVLEQRLIQFGLGRLTASDLALVDRGLLSVLDLQATS